MELLSPAGSSEAVIAAVQSGADAIYFGFGAFNARKNAKNLTDEEFEAAVRYCRVRGCKVYLTLNTLVADREMAEATRLAKFASDLGVDAALVQDLGLARVLRSYVPELKLHASTQMSVHNLAGAQAAAEMGFSRVVLARELNLANIAHIAQNSPIETEVFVHGALCFCYSGQCYMSAVIGRRSGNRGMCAQPCRLQYSMGSRMDNNYPLSLKDNCLARRLGELETAGVSCVKIEGRMRRPEYTAIVTGIYARALKEKKEPTAAEMEQLETAFSRQGFTDGYLTGDLGSGMFGIREEPDEKAYQKLFADTRKAYSGTELRRVPIKFYAMLKAGEASQFAAEDLDGHRVVKNGPKPQLAVSQQLTDKALADQLYKTGGTPYTCVDVRAAIQEGLYLPASAINEVRRSLVAKLTEQRKLPPARKPGRMPMPPVNLIKREPPKLNFQFSSPEQMAPALAELKPDRVYVPLEVIDGNFPALMPFLEEGAVPVAVMPRVIHSGEDAGLKELLARARTLGVREALIGNLGHVRLLRTAGFELRGNFGLNAFNSFSLEVLAKAGFLSATASFELRLRQISDLQKPLDTELLAYGRLPLMITEQCLIKNNTGRCACDAPGQSQLSDRQGALFPVMKTYGCRNEILNAKKLFLADKREDYANIGLWGIRLLFTTESARECLSVAKSYLGMIDYKPNGVTRGLYYRGVE